MVVFVPMLLVFVLVQRKGLLAFLAKFARKLFGERFTGLVQDAEGLDRTLADVYDRRTAVLMCVVWQLLGWCAGALEIWLALYVLGVETSMTNAVIIESLIQAISSSAFIVPGALGLQEGGFVVVGGFLGVPRETALALALMRRARDILLFLPALAAWQYSLGKRLFRPSLKNE
jgi:putative membrane protein